MGQVTAPCNVQASLDQIDPLIFPGPKGNERWSGSTCSTRSPSSSGSGPHCELIDGRSRSKYALDLLAGTVAGHCDAVEMNPLRFCGRTMDFNAEDCSCGANSHYPVAMLVGPQAGPTCIPLDCELQEGCNSWMQYPHFKACLCASMQQDREDGPSDGCARELSRTASLVGSKQNQYQGKSNVRAVSSQASVSIACERQENPEHWMQNVQVQGRLRAAMEQDRNTGPDDVGSDANSQTSDVASRQSQNKGRQKQKTLSLAKASSPSLWSGRFSPQEPRELSKSPTRSSSISRMMSLSPLNLRSVSPVHRRKPRRRSISLSLPRVASQRLYLGARRSSAPTPACREEESEAERRRAQNETVRRIMASMRRELTQNAKAPKERSSSQRREVMYDLETSPSAAAENLKIFLKANGFSGVNSKRSRLTSTVYPIHVAAAKGDADMLRLLLDAGADPAQKNSGGLTAEQVAKKLRPHSSAVLKVFQNFSGNRH
mmetsp:Transcript_42756/g.118050  ORF Transcript_42756/g.118050 Transcript_42756/m.118050 type:complete len:488 (+) Transcript_42756:78-1541(+)